MKVVHRTSRTAIVNPFGSASAVAQSNYCVFDGKRLVRLAAGRRLRRGPALCTKGFARSSSTNISAALPRSPPSVRATIALACTTSSRRSARARAWRGICSRSCTTWPPPEFSKFPSPVSTGHYHPTRRRSNSSHLGARCSGCTILTSSTTTGTDAAKPTHLIQPFSFAGTAFFVVGLHAASSRTTRRFAWPTLVFNPHQQFDQLREVGLYSRFQRVIRDAELDLQGEINPMLSDFGERSEAPQYSGRQVGPEWRRPFHATPAPSTRTPGNNEPPTNRAPGRTCLRHVSR